MPQPWISFVLRPARLLLFRHSVTTKITREPNSLFFIEDTIMLSWALTFLVIALIAGVLGFGGLMGAAASIAKILFLVFLVFFVISLIAGRRPVV